MAPPENVMKIYKNSVKGKTNTYIPQYPNEMTNAVTIIQDMVDTVVTTIKSVIPIDSNTNKTIPDDDANEVTNVNIPNIFNPTMNMSSNNTNSTTFNENNSTMFFPFTTTFEEVTTMMSDLDENIGVNMKHHDKSNEYNSVLFIILGVVLGILILVAVVLGVVYSHYRKRGFQEISDKGQIDPQSMKQLQEASSHDALLHK